MAASKRGTSPNNVRALSCMIAAAMSGRPIDVGLLMHDSRQLKDFISRKGRGSLTESGVILVHLEDVGLLCEEDSFIQRANTLERILLAEKVLIPPLSELVFEEPQNSSTASRKLIRRLGEELSCLNSELRTKSSLVDDRMSVGDVPVATALPLPLHHL